MDALAPFYRGERDDLPGADPGYVLVGPVAKRLFKPIRVPARWKLVASTPSYSLWSRRPGP